MHRLHSLALGTRARDRSTERTSVDLVSDWSRVVALTLRPAGSLASFLRSRSRSLLLSRPRPDTRNIFSIFLRPLFLSLLPLLLLLLLLASTRFF